MFHLLSMVGIRKKQSDRGDACLDMGLVIFYESVFFVVKVNTALKNKG